MTRRFCRNESVCEDAVDEAISRLLKIEVRTENVFPLLYQISKNILFDRKKRVLVARRKAKIIKNSAPRSTTPLQNSILAEFGVCLKGELLSMREMDRQIFESICVDGLSSKEVAFKLGLSDSNVKTRLFRVRRFLRSRLERFAS